MTEALGGPSERIRETRAENFDLADIASPVAMAIVAVGTTAMRVLETATRNNKLLRRQVEPKSGETDLFIYPPFTFRVVDALLTNFHLPRSTLLMLVSAFAGREFILRAYEEAVRARYRFYSYGDCMLIL